MKLLSVFLIAVSLTGTAYAVSPDRVLLDKGWRTVADINVGYTDRDVDTSKWKETVIPHDWSICFNPDSTANSGNDGGYLPGVKATYTRTLDVDSILPGRYMIYVEGAYMNPSLWINGEEVDSHTYGYTSFRVDVTDYLETGSNRVTITVDNSRQKNSRWYSGTGLIRPVWLEHYNEVYVEPWSMQFSSPGIRPGMAIGRIEANLIDSRADHPAARSVTATLIVTQPDGVALQPEVQQVTLRQGQAMQPVLFDLPLPDPQLWSPDTPSLYTARLSVNDGSGHESVEEITFGLRSFDFDAEEGAFLNEEPILINGACVHHDNGMLGAAAFQQAEWRKAKLLKQAGFNAVRTAHNPPSTAFLDACDRLGLLVIDEAFDGWAQAKTSNDYSEVFETEWPVDLEAMVRRDRNHPSVIAWSIGNEVPESVGPEAVDIAGEMIELCRSLDASRPVTQALAPTDGATEVYDRLADQHDIVGYNYMIDKAKGDHERVPDRVIWQTESYPRDAFNNYVAVRDLPYVIGDFVWTGIDYLGESGIGRHYYEGEVSGEHYDRDLWPWHAAVCGDIDLIGQRKPVSYYRDMLYNNSDGVYISVREPDNYRGKIRETKWGTYPLSRSWNWPGHEDKPIEIEAYTRQPKVKLYLDDKEVAAASVGESTQYKAVLTVPYQAGVLRVVAFDAKGNEVAADEIVTATGSSAINLSYDRVEGVGVDYDLIFVTASIVDSEGRVNPLDDSLLQFSVTDNARLIATGSADPTDLVGYTLPMRQAFNGRAAAVIMTARGVVPTLTVSSNQLKPVNILLTK